MGGPPHSLTRIFQVHIEALPGSRHLYGPDGLSATFLSHGRAHGSSQLREGKQNAEFKDKGVGEEPLIAWVQLVGQPAFMFSL